ncbi:DUF559 domain-containing protein [Methylocystis echinoides]|uniref:DUF559 domain-containing protein n=1 Tax=Methylocystis echinoides TaxID=29468 RepID=UPI00342C4A42
MQLQLFQAVGGLDAVQSLPFTGRVARARALRKTMTPQEVKLWVHLRKLRPEGLHFVETILARARETEGEAL